MNKLFDYKELSTEQFGLKFRPTISPEIDDMDWYPYGNIDGQLVDMNHKHQQITIEFSDNDKSALLKIMNELKAKNSLNSILEIGVARSGGHSSSVFMVNNKNKDTKYFGVDLNPGVFAGFENPQNNVHCLCTNSSNTQQIMDWMKSHGADKIDLLHIDGLHSINQVMRDFLFAQFVNVGGYVCGHDVAVHPGPHCVYDAISEEYFEKNKYFFDPLENDWGFFVAKRLK